MSPVHAATAAFARASPLPMSISLMPRRSRRRQLAALPKALAAGGRLEAAAPLLAPAVLAHRHPWVQLAAARLLGRALACLDPKVRPALAGSRHPCAPPCAALNNGPSVPADPALLRRSCAWRVSERGGAGGGGRTGGRSPACVRGGVCAFPRARGADRRGGLRREARGPGASPLSRPTAPKAAATRVSRGQTASPPMAGSRAPRPAGRGGGGELAGGG